MLRMKRPARLPLAALAALVAVMPVLRAAADQDKLHEAYYLEHAKGDLAGAAKLYRAVVSDRDAGRKVRAEARKRLAACREELASNDFASLMPPSTLVYAEINRPGEQVLKLLGQLGLLADAERTAKKGAQRLAISPALINEIIGLRGIGIAITGFDPRHQKPSGVIVMHPGNLEVIRAALETALPIAAQPLEPIEGFATFNIENEAVVTLTSRLIIAATDADQIRGVIRRLQGKEKQSLATNKDVADTIKNRGDSLLYFCANVQALMPMIEQMAAHEAGAKEMAIIKAVLDPENIKTISGSVGVSDDGLFVNLGVNLAKGHRNLVYNFLRLPPIDEATLKRIPQGAAAFFAVAMNESESRYSPTGGADSDEEVIVTGLDIFRELFANVIGVAVYVLPPDGDSTGGPIPDVAAVVTVHDPSKSKALWTQFLGLGAMAAGTGVPEGKTAQIAGTEVTRFDFPEGITVYFAAIGNDVLISPSRSAIARSIAAKRRGRSILDDKGFGKAIERIGPNSTIAAFVHPARCLEIAKQHMSARELAEIEPFVGRLTDTVASFVVDHSSQSFRLSAMVTGLPEIGDLVSQLIAAEMGHGPRQARVSQASFEQVSSPKPKQTKESRRAREKAESVDSLLAKFDRLALKEDDREGALMVAERVYKSAHDDANALNTFAWNLLTEDRYDGKYNKLALRLSKRSNEITDQANWMYVDTLAWAHFKLGDVRKAVRLENKALELAGDHPRRGEGEESLKTFRAALEKPDQQRE